jgi:excisionase family DNA binding protein
MKERPSSSPAKPGAGSRSRKARKTSTTTVKKRSRSPSAERSSGGASLAVALGEAGIHATPSDFLTMVREALESLRTVSAPDPRGQLTATEEVALRRGGFETRRARRGEQRPLESTVASFVAMMDEAMSVAEAAKRLRVDQSRVRQLLAAGSLYGIKVHGEWRLPRFQFTPRGTVTGIQEVLREVPRDLHPVEVLGWLRNPDPDLEMGDQAVSPLEWLRSGGDPARASEVARDL